MQNRQEIMQKEIENAVQSVPTDITVPWWAAALATIITAMMPFLIKYFDKKKCEERCAELQKELKELKEALEEEKESAKTTRENYLQLKGAVITIRKKLLAAGYEDIPGLE